MLERGDLLQWNPDLGDWEACGLAPSSGAIAYFDGTVWKTVSPPETFTHPVLSFEGGEPVWAEDQVGDGGGGGGETGWPEPAGTQGDMLYHNGTTWVKFDHAGEPAANEIYALSQTGTAAPTWKKLKKYAIDLCSGGTPTTFTLYGEP